MFSRLLGVFSADMAIDLGTVNTLVYVKGRGVVLNEPTVVAISSKSGRTHVLAVGNETFGMTGRTPENIRVVHPIRAGVIADFAAATEMIKYLMRQIHNRNGFFSPRVIITTPSGATALEQKSVCEAAEAAGARRVVLVKDGMAAAMGAGLPVTEARGSIVVDIGGGRTEVAVVSLGNIVYARSVEIGGHYMDDAIVAYVRRVHNVLISNAAAADVKSAIGTAWMPINGSGLTYEVRGRDLMNGVPRALDVTQQQISLSLTEAVGGIIETVKTVLEHIAPELAADIVDSGIALTGGGALLGGLAEALSEAIGIPVFVVNEPLLCAVKGAGQTLEMINDTRLMVGHTFGR